MLTITNLDNLNDFNASATKCPQPDADSLFKQLTNIKVLNAQIIDDETARGVSNELITTVRCNATEATKKIVIPAIAFAGFATLAAIIATTVAIRRR